MSIAIGAVVELLWNVAVVVEKMPFSDLGYSLLKMELFTISMKKEGNTFSTFLALKI